MLFSRRSARSRARIVPVMICAATVTALQATAAADTTPIFSSFAGVEICQSVISSWGGTRYGDVPIGSFASDGSVVDGAAVVAVYADLGSAPLSSLAFPATTDSRTGQAMVVDPLRPQAAGTLNAAGLNWKNGIAIQPHLIPALEGPDSGTARIGIALLTRRDQPLREALGVTQDLNVVRDRCLGAIGAPIERPLTVGGAAEFGASPTLQLTAFGQPINDGPNATESVFRAGRSVPVKISLVDLAGAVVSDDVGQALSSTCSVTLAVTAGSGSIGPINEQSLETEATTTGSCLHFDADEKQFVVNWPTKDLRLGRYALRVTVTEATGASVSHEVTVALR